MLRKIAVITVALIAAGSIVPAGAAEYRKSPGQTEPARSQLRKTPDIGNASGNINTDPAMTNSTTTLKNPSNAPGTDCRNGNGQTYPNANTDNPPGFQPCPQ
jgi:hypothetical protein